jgi:hypothetical protein
MNGRRFLDIVKTIRIEAKIEIIKVVFIVAHH